MARIPSSIGRSRAPRAPWRAGISLALFLLAAFSTSRRPCSDAEPKEVLLGMSTVLSGPAADLGLEMKAGVDAALAEANRQGGIKGRTIRLLSLDDGYEPTRAAPNMHRLVEKDRVLAVIGNVGTPTAVASIPIAMAAKVPLVGAFTGAGILRKTPPDRYVVNFRASYAEETGTMVDALVRESGLKPEEIGFFTQRDAYGDAGFSGGAAALARHGLVDQTAVAHGRYDRNTTAVENGLADILQASVLPRAVIMVGAYAPCAAFIKLARQHQLHVVFLNVSFVGTAALAKALGSDGDGVIVTQVVPPLESDLAIVRAYRSALAALDAELEPSFGSLEGYVAARMLLLALGRIEGRLTGDAVVDALERLGEFDLGLGFPLRLAPDQHQACHTVWPTVLRGGRAVPFEWNELRVAGATAGK